LVRKFADWEFDSDGQPKAPSTDEVMRRTMDWISRPLGVPSTLGRCQLYDGRDCPGCVAMCVRFDEPIPPS